MRKNDPKANPQAVVVRGILALVLFGLLVVPIAVQAELKAVSRAHSWDHLTNKFEWGHVIIEFDPYAEEERWIPLLQEVYFDDLFGRVPRGWEPWICDEQEPELTFQYAGWIEYGLPLTDTLPVDARGFQSSDPFPDDTEKTGWVLLDCDLNGDLEWNPDDLTVMLDADDVAQQALVECTPDGDNCEVRYQDQVQDCPAATSEHCTHELATQLIIRLDTNCDGTIEEDSVTESLAEAARDRGLCVYGWAKLPVYEVGDPVWSFPLPIRITDADGAKTLMLDAVPTAVDLVSFKAEPQGRDVLVSWETASEIDNAGFNLYRSEAGGERIRLNDWLIPSQNPGSVVGSSYQFVDRSAEPDTAYQYWLEDIDLAGAVGMNGPFAVQTPRSRFLPCRPRPAPMPLSQ